MRQKLQAVDGRRITVTATFGRFGIKPGYKGPPIKTVLLTELRDTAGHEVCDHLWFTYTKGFKALDLKAGDRIQFDGRAKNYVKGYRGNRDSDADAPTVDYKLSHPTHIRKINPQPVDTLPLFLS